MAVAHPKRAIRVRRVAWEVPGRRAVNPGAVEAAVLIGGVALHALGLLALLAGRWFS